MNDVKMLKRDNLHLKLRVQELESDMETIKRMLKTIVIDKPTKVRSAILQGVFRTASSIASLLRYTRRTYVHLIHCVTIEVYA